MSRPLLLISLAAFLMMTGLSIIFPVLPFYVRWLELSEAQAGVLMSVYALASVVASPFWGRFSERYGRKPALLIGLFGFSLAFGWFGLGKSFGELLAARALGGLLAAATQPAIFAYAADVSASSERTAAMGFVGAAFGLGIVAGPVLGGLLAPLGLRVPFLTTAAIGALAFLAVLFLLPESLSQERRVRAASAPAVRARSLLAGPLVTLLALSFLFQTARMGLESTLGFLAEDRLGAGPRAVGLLLGALGFLAAGLQGGGMRALSKRYSDPRLLLFGCALAVVGLVGMAGAAGWGTLALAGAGIVLGGALVSPALTSMLSRIDETAQGQTQGLNQSAQSLGRVVGPLLFTTLYQASGTVAPYLAAAGVGTLALLLATRVRAGQ